MIFPSPGDSIITGYFSGKTRVGDGMNIMYSHLYLLALVKCFKFVNDDARIKNPFDNFQSWSETSKFCGHFQGYFIQQFKLSSTTRLDDAFVFLTPILPPRFLSLIFGMKMEGTFGMKIPPGDIHTNTMRQLASWLFSSNVHGSHSDFNPRFNRNEQPPTIFCKEIYERFISIFILKK
jgi:hypothetical protein